MPLKTYVKTGYVAAVTWQPEPGYFAYQPLTLEQPKQAFTMWNVLSGSYNGLKHLVATSSVAGLVIPSLFIMAGLFVIYQQFQPAITQQIKEQAGYFNQGTAALVDESYIADRLQYVSNPGADYFRQLTESAFNETRFVPDLESGKYHGTMYLTIPSLGFEKIPVAANVESGVKAAYDQVLTSALAHFKGTSLPFAQDPNNIVIYGHSAGGSYHPTPDDPLAAFSFLSELKVGDEIILEMDGEIYKYRMSRSKIVEPNDTSIIAGSPGKESLTLFTCYPNGNNSKRYVAIATPIV